MILKTWFVEVNDKALIQSLNGFNYQYTDNNKFCKINIKTTITYTMYEQ